MLLRFLPCLLALVLFACNDPTTAKTDQVQRDEIDEVLEQIMPEYNIPGLSLVVVRGDSVILQKSAGEDIDHSTLFSGQSISKTFTSLACLTLVEDGVLDLDAPIVNYLPAFSVNSLHEADAASKITLRHLLSHTSGLPADAPVGNNFVPNFEGDVYAPLAERVSSIQEVWLRTQVGQQYSYSNVGFDLVAHIVDQASGRSFAAYVQEEVLLPLGMEHSTFDLGTVPTLPNVAKGHCEGYDGIVPVQFSAIGAGGLYTSSEDLSKFLTAALNRFTTVLSDSLYQELVSIPFANASNGYALGLTVNDIQYCTPVYSHTGNGYGFTASMLWIPEENLGIAILSNRESVYNAHVLMHEAIFSSDLVAARFDSSCQDIASYPNTLAEEDLAYYKSVAGDYSNGSITLTFEVRENAFGVLSPSDGSFIRIHFRSRNQWLIDDGELIRFTLDGQLLTNQNNGMTFTKVLADSDTKGANKPEWQQYVGRYRAFAYGVLGSSESIALENGHLHLNGNRLTEHQPGLFFDQFGQVVDFRSDGCAIEYGEYLRVEQ